MNQNKFETIPSVNEQEHIAELIRSGEYTEASRAIRALISQGEISAKNLKTLNFEVERMARIRKDFTATADDVLAFIKPYISNITESDLAVWEDDYSLEYRIIDGEKLFFELAARNLFRINPDLRKIWEKHYPNGEISSGSGATTNLDRHIAEIIDKVITSSQQFVMPTRIRIKHEVSVPANSVPPGETVKCWLPFPRSIKNRQVDVELLASNPMKHIISPETSLQRTIYFEKSAVADKATTFFAEYELTSYGFFQDIDPDLVTEPQLNDSLQEFLKEEVPHITFSDELRELSVSIIGNENIPYRKAQLIFAWMNENIPWASAREYSTIGNIPDYVYKNRHGDCGIQTLFFITLCRLNGIPARWQSGWELQPPEDSMHDWGMIYFEPYGWVPMDITYGLRQSSDDKLKWFYLGGMDGYRIIYNDGYKQDLTPRKHFFRSDTLDNQRGELEWSGGNLYFDQWQWKYTWKIL